MSRQGKYIGIHRQQLFHWIGPEIDRSSGFSGSLSDLARSRYLECLRGTLEDGLWVKAPREPELIRHAGKELSLDRPIVCFTEWSVGESLSHTRRYGRLGLGFSKSWVLERGGQPVTYYRHAKGSFFLRALVRIWRSLEEQSCADEFRYLMHFTKRVHKPNPSRDQPRKKAVRRVTPPSPVRQPVASDPFVRKYGKTMPYLEEREWRIVAHPHLDRPSGREDEHWVRNPKSPGRLPPFFLKYAAGRELFTLVLPDNQAVSQVLGDSWFTGQLFPKRNPHVTVLSLQDIGTF